MNGWEVRIVADRERPGRQVAKAVFRVDGKATRMITRDNLTEEEVATWSPKMSWRSGLSAYQQRVGGGE